MGKKLEMKGMGELTKEQRKRALSTIAVGRDVLEGVLRTNTRASGRFNQGADLLIDWNNIHMKSAYKESNQREGEEEMIEDRESNKSSRSKGTSSNSLRGRDEDQDDFSLSPAKRPKTNNAEIEVIRAHLVGAQAENKRFSDSLAECKRSAAAETTMLRQSNAKVSDLKKSVDELERKLALASDAKDCVEHLETRLVTTSTQLNLERQEHQVQFFREFRSK